MPKRRSTTTPARPRTLPRANGQNCTCGRHERRWCPRCGMAGVGAARQPKGAAQSRRTQFARFADAPTDARGRGWHPWLLSLTLSTWARRNRMLSHPQGGLRQGHHSLLADLQGECDKAARTRAGGRGWGGGDGGDMHHSHDNCRHGLDCGCRDPCGRSKGGWRGTQCWLHTEAGSAYAPTLQQARPAANAWAWPCRIRPLDKASQATCPVECITHTRTHARTRRATGTRRTAATPPRRGCNEPAPGLALRVTPCRAYCQPALWSL
jgi:hypothetical protein